MSAPYQGPLSQRFLRTTHSGDAHLIEYCDIDGRASVVQSFPTGREAHALAEQLVNSSGYLWCWPKYGWPASPTSSEWAPIIAEFIINHCRHYGRPLTDQELTLELVTVFPRIPLEEVHRGAAIAQELLDADLAWRASP